MKYKITQTCSVHLSQLNATLYFKKGDLVDDTMKDSSQIIGSLLRMNVCEKMDQKNYDNKMMQSSYPNK